MRNLIKYNRLVNSLYDINHKIYYILKYLIIPIGLAIFGKI